MNTWITQLRKGLMEFCILNLLKNNESYGYEILQSLQEIKKLVITDSTVYPILSRLRKDRYLMAREIQSNSGPPRKYFSLTPIGDKRIQEMNFYWDGLLKAINDLRNNKNKRRIKNDIIKRNNKKNS